MTTATDRTTRESVYNTCGHEAHEVYRFNRRKDYTAIVARVRTRKCQPCISRAMPTN